MIAKGFDLNKNLLLVQNSWGSDFGSNGSCWMDADLIFNKDIFSEAWTIIDSKDIVV